MSPPAAIGATPRTVVEVSGSDRLTYLDAVLSQAMGGLVDGDVRGALFLDIHGLSLAMVDVVVEPERVLLICADRAQADYVVTTLGGRTFLADARFAIDDDLGVDIVRGGTTTLPTPPTVERALIVGGCTVLLRPWGLDVLGDAPARAGYRDTLAGVGVGVVSAEELAILQVAASEPRWGVEVVAPHLPEELGLLPTHVHLAKGCYPGQEAVARMWMLGRPRRRLAAVVAGGSVAAGWSSGEGRGRATVTSLATNTQRGLAFVPGAAATGDRFTEDGGWIEVVEFVGGPGTPPGHDPAVLRRRDRRAG